MRRHTRTPAPAHALAAALALATLVAGWTGCGPRDANTRERVILVTTTTVEDSGLLDTLVAAYHRSQDRYRLATTAVGSGAALALGRRGDADLLLTHDSAGEAALMAEGAGAEQGPVMRNEFLVVGPPRDPAGVRGMTDLAAALARIDAAGAPFVSRADDSGTHRRELALRERAGLPPPAGMMDARPDARPDAGPGAGSRAYIEAGAGMAETLRVASQRGGYALVDRGTFLHLRPTLELEALAAGDPPELNRYRYTLPRTPRNEAGARHFLGWLLGPGQALIRRYGADRFDPPLFEPAAGPAAPGEA